MAPQSERIHTTEDTLTMLRERSKESDEFTVKVQRRLNNALPPQLVATLSGATVQHIVSPELWIPQLCGGGKYMMQGYHASDLNKPVGGFVQFNVEAEPRDVDGSVLKKETWRGPAQLDFPQKEPPRQQQAQEGLYDIRPPPGPGSGDSATSSPQAWPRPPGGGFQRQEYSQQDQWRRDAAALEHERRKIEDERLQNAREKHTDALEAVKKSHEADMRALKMEMMGAIQQAKPSGPDGTSTLLMEMMKQQAEDRRAAATQAAEDRRVQLAAQERADARFLTMMEKMFDRPKENPLEMVKQVAEILGGKKGGNDGIIEAQTKMMHSMTEMMGQQVGVAMDFVSAAADMQLGAQGEKEPAWIKGIESVVKSVGAMAKGAARRPVAPPPQTSTQALPAQAVQQAPRPPAPKEAVPPSAIDQIEIAIRARTQVSLIAKALVDHFQDPTIQQALIESMGDFEGYVSKRLGNWVNEDPVNNPEYLKQLFAEIEKQFIAAGHIAGPDQEEDAEIEEENEAEENDEGEENAE